MLGLFVRTGITTMNRMRALLTDTTDRIGSWAACSSEQDPGSTDFMGVAPFGVVGSMDAVGLDEADLVAVDLEAAGLKAVDSPDEADSEAAGASLVAER